MYSIERPDILRDLLRLMVGKSHRSYTQEESDNAPDIETLAWRRECGTKDMNVQQLTILHCHIVTSLFQDHDKVGSTCIPTEIISRTNLSVILIPLSLSKPTSPKASHHLAYFQTSQTEFHPTVKAQEHLPPLNPG